MERIGSLESLRGLLAFWVVLGHTIKSTGYSSAGPGPFKLLAQPGLAVDVFIILSGFVIFSLLDRQSTTYRAFIVKRWFRLAPVYLSALCVAALMVNWKVSMLSSFPFSNMTVANNVVIAADTQKYLLAQFLAHLTMLHGMLSNSILPSSDYAFLGAAWSISVEWQFYLLAPWLYSLIVMRRTGLLALVILAICVIRAVNYGGEGFAVNQAGYFIVGIASYYLWKHSPRWKLEAGQMQLLTVVALAAVYLLVQRSVSLLLWIVVLSCIIAEKMGQLAAIQRWILQVLHWPGLLWLGKISYSVYLVHMLVFYALAGAFLTLYPGISQFHLLSLMLVAVPVGTLLVSSLTYRYIERPGMDMGQKYVARHRELAGLRG